MSAVKVETAAPEDEDAVMDLCRMLHRENGLLRFHEQAVLGAIRRALNCDRSVLGVIRKGGAIVGCVCIEVTTMWYSTDAILSEIFNFVHPDHRRSGHAKALIKFAKEASDRLELALFIGVLSNHRTEAKVRLYQRQLDQAGAFFIHNPHFIQPEGHVDGR